jgi:hypothetical protein
MAPSVDAHNVEVFAGPGFRFGGILDTEEGEADITNTVGLTTTLAVRAREDAFFEFTYSFQPASLEVEDVTGPALTAFDLGVHYIQLGGIIEWPHEAYTPFFGLTAGVVVFDPEPEGFTTETRFAGSLFGGVKRMLTPRVGLRGEGRIWMTYFPEDLNLFCSLPGYCAISVSGEALFQGETAGGVFVTF